MDVRRHIACPFSLIHIFTILFPLSTLIQFLFISLNLLLFRLLVVKYFPSQNKTTTTLYKWVETSLSTGCLVFLRIDIITFEQNPVFENVGLFLTGLVASSSATRARTLTTDQPSNKYWTLLLLKQDFHNSFQNSCKDRESVRCYDGSRKNRMLQPDEYYCY